MAGGRVGRRVGDGAGRCVGEPGKHPWANDRRRPPARPPRGTVVAVPAPRRRARGLGRGSRPSAVRHLRAGPLLVPLLAWLLMLGGGLTMRVRLRRRGAVSYRSAALGAVQERFEYWCDT